LEIHLLQVINQTIQALHPLNIKYSLYPHKEETHPLMITWVVRLLSWLLSK